MIGEPLREMTIASTLPEMLAGITGLGDDLRLRSPVLVRELLLEVVAAGAGLGAVIRNLGGAVTAVVLALFMIPPLLVQMVSEAESWIPPTLGAVLSGVNTDVNVWAAAAAK